MKIAIICYNHFDATISLGKYLKQIDKKTEVHFIFLLSQSFLDVEIITLQGKGIKNGFVDKEQMSKVIDREISIYLNDIASFDVFVFNSYNLADLKNIKLLFKLRSSIIKKKFDVLHFVGNSPWIILLNSSFRKQPKVHTLHEPYPFSGHSNYRLLRHRLKIKLLINSNNHIIVPSIISHTRFTDNFDIDSARLSIVPFGPLEIFKSYLTNPILKKDDIILFYGNITQYKGIDTLMSAIPLVYKSNPSLKFIIAGAGQLDDELVKSHPNLQVINRHLTNKQVAELNQLATVIVCPYRSASQSGVVMTSFAFNNPIIATNVGALPEFVENGITGVIIEPGNSEMLSEIIIKLFESEGMIENLRANIKAKYSNSEHSWSNIASKTYHLYEKQIQFDSEKG